MGNIPVQVQSNSLMTDFFNKSKAKSTQPISLITKYSNVKKDEYVAIQPNPNQDKKDSKTTKNKLFLALGVAVVIITALIAKSKIKNINIKPDTKVLEPQNTPKGSSTGKIIKSTEDFIKDFISELPDSGKFKLENELNKNHFNLERFNLVKFFNEQSSDFLPLKHAFVAKKSGLAKFAKLPPVIALTNVTASKMKDVTKILTSMYDLHFVASTKYTKGQLKEFIESLENFSIESLKRFNEEKNLSVLHFDNPAEFFSDLNEAGNKEFKQRFENLIHKNTENKIAYVMDKDSSASLDSVYVNTINFDKKIKTCDLTKDLEEHDFKLESKLLKKIKGIDDELAQYIHAKSNSFTYFYLKSLIFDNPKEKFLLIEGKQKEIADDIVNLISSKTGHIHKRVDCSSSIKELLPILTEKQKQAEEFYNRTGKKTFLFLENIEKMLDIDKNSSEYEKLKELLANEQNHSIIVINPQSEESKVYDLISQKSSYKLDIHPFGGYNGVYQQSINLMTQRMNANEFSPEVRARLKREFFDRIALERSGIPLPENALPTNGILLYGPDKATEVTANSIIKTVDAYHQKITFDKNNPEEMLDLLSAKAEEAKKLFNETGKRTILEIEKLDEFLTNKDGDNILLIACFKGIEHFSKVYHTTILARTSRSLSDFETASIGSNRFELKIKAE